MSTPESAPLTQQQIAEWKRLADAATPGPMLVVDARSGAGFAYGNLRSSSQRIADGNPGQHEGPVFCAEIVAGSKADADFYAEARAAVPALIAEVARLQTEVERLREEPTGIALIRAERVRQITDEGYSPEHDDAHADDGVFSAPALPQAAAIYAVTAHNGEKAIIGCQNPGWPWDMKWFKPAPQLRMLVKAGALIAAEIDRVLRAADREVQG